MTTFKTFAAVLTLALAAAATAPAYALCDLCTAEVRLDSGLAGCFVQRSADAGKQLAAGKGFVFIDLSNCADRGGLPTGASDDAPLPLDVRFVVDAAGLKCLNDAIAAMPDTDLTPSHLFDLARDCPSQ